MITITPAIHLNENDVRFEFVRSSGPGGQNVNKVATSVQLRFDVDAASLPEEVRSRLRRLAGKKMTAGGELIIQASRYRSQEHNRRDALERLCALIRKASQPRRTRRKTVPSAAARKRRLENKRFRSRLKAARKKPGETE